MDNREKLIELMIEAKRTDDKTMPWSEWLVDYLIAHGVTFAKDTNVPGKPEPPEEG